MRLVRQGSLDVSDNPATVRHMTRIYPPARRRMAYREDPDVADALDSIAADSDLPVRDLIRAATRAHVRRQLIPQQRTR